jgi:hypothetical protein
MTKKKETKRSKIDGRRSKLKHEREKRLQFKIKSSMKKRENEELFQMIKPDHLDKLDIDSKKNILDTLFKLLISFPNENSDKFKLLLTFLNDKSAKIILKSIECISSLLFDIIPSYRIRTDESKQKLSKEVGSVVNYERAILGLYEEFINNLKIFLKAFSKKDNENTKIIREKAVEVIGQLFEKYYYFNFEDELFKILIEHLYDKNKDIRKNAFQCLYNVLAVANNATSVLEMKLAMIKLLSHFIFIKPHELFDDNVLDLLTAHRIEFPDLNAEKEKHNLDNIKFGKKESLQMAGTNEKQEKKERKKLAKEKDKILKNLQREIGEYETVNNNKGIYYTNLKILKKVLLIYFDILKNKRSSTLIRSVLQGIGILVENINVEILLDLQKCLHSFIQHQLKESKDKKVYSISALKTCLTITEKLTKDIISIDDSNLTYSAYLFLHVMSKHTDQLSKDDLFILIEVIEVLFIKNRQFAIDKVAAFVKRIAIFTTYLGSKYVSSFLLLIKRIIGKYPSLTSMLDNDEDGFNYSETDPGLSNGRLANILPELNQINTKYGAIKLIKQLCEFVRNSEKVNPTLSSLNYFDLLI